MKYFAQIDENNIVVQIIAATQDVIDSGELGDPERWLETHFDLLDGNPGVVEHPIRKNAAAVGYTYSKQHDAFIPPAPFPSWVLDENTCLFYPPIPYPDDAGQGDPPAMYVWNEDKLGWDQISSGSVVAN